MIRPDQVAILFLSVKKQEHLIEEATKQGFHWIDGKKVPRPVKLPDGVEYLIRYGSRAGSANPERLNEVLNRSEGIKQWSDKLAGRKRMNAMHDDVFFDEKTWTFPDTIDLSNHKGVEAKVEAIRGWFQNGGKVVIRKNTHTRGNSLWLVDNIDDARNVIRARARTKMYAQKAIDKKSEYRVYFLDGAVLAVFEKVPVDKNAFYWGGDGANWVYRTKKNTPNSMAVKELVADVCSQSLIDFGAIDLIQGNDGKMYALEVNTCFETQGPYMAKKFLAAARQWFDSPNAWLNDMAGDWVFNKDLYYHG